jgi:hypothetical protein
MRTAYPICALLAAMLAGCAAPSVTSAPSHRPTDQVKKSSWLVGTVTAGGSGPCYSLSTDDGTAYALHSPDRVFLTRGSRVRVLVRPAVARIWCGPGKMVEMTAADPVR